MDPDVYLVGPCKLHNDMMVSFLEGEMGLSCWCSEKMKLPAIANKRKDHTPLILWDCLETHPEDLWTGPGVWNDPCGFQHFLVLFNVSPEAGIEVEAARRGARGIFYKNTPSEIFAKGIQAIIKGDLWFSRDSVGKLFLELKDATRLSKGIQSALFTPREKEILLIIAVGATNAEIADSLCISPHTVRTHTYKIYQKIQVTNRLQAALWAIKNL